MASLHGRVAVVTGSAGGIGQAIARRFAADGAKVVAADIRNACETGEMIGNQGVIVQADVSSEEGWGSIAQVAEPLGGVDIVINNAAIYPFSMIDDVETSLWKKVMATNLDSVFYSAKQFVPTMRAREWGRFINIASNAIGTSGPALSHYMASKMGSIGFVRGLANDVGGSGITANAVLPSLTATPGTVAVPDEMRDMVVEMQAVKRRATPEDVTGIVAFLASDEAAFITGQTISADGGLFKVT